MPQNPENQELIPHEPPELSSSRERPRDPDQRTPIAIDRRPKDASFWQELLAGESEGYDARVTLAYEKKHSMAEPASASRNIADPERGIQLRPSAHEAQQLNLKTYRTLNTEFDGVPQDESQSQHPTHGELHTAELPMIS